MFDFNQKIDAAELDLKDTVVSINRVTKVVKGGKNLSFSALVVVGDGHGHVGFGIGKAKEVPSAIKKGIESAKKALVRVPLAGTTLVSASTTEPALKAKMTEGAKGGNLAGAKAIGVAVAERLKAKGITKVVFDRNGFLYHGRIKAVADAARSAGLEF